MAHTFLLRGNLDSISWNHKNCMGWNYKHQSFRTHAIVKNDNKYQLLQIIVQDKIEGKRRLGRQKLTWMNNSRKYLYMTFVPLALEKF